VFLFSICVSVFSIWGSMLSEIISESEKMETNPIPIIILIVSIVFFGRDYPIK